MLPIFLAQNEQFEEVYEEELEDGNEVIQRGLEEDEQELEKTQKRERGLVEFVLGFGLVSC